MGEAKVIAADGYEEGDKGAEEGRDVDGIGYGCKAFIGFLGNAFSAVVKGETIYGKEKGVCCCDAEGNGDLGGL